MATIPEHVYDDLAGYYDELFTAAAEMFPVIQASITYVQSLGDAAPPALRDAVVSYVEKNGEDVPFSSYAR